MAAARQQEEALAGGEYHGPLQGIPIGIKDNIKVGGVRATIGSKVFADYVADEDAQVVALCKMAGAIILGKENLEGVRRGGDLQQPPLRGSAQSLVAGPRARRIQRGWGSQRGGLCYLRLPGDRHGRVGAPSG